MSNLNKLVFTINFCYEKQIAYILSCPGKRVYYSLIIIYNKFGESEINNISA